MKAGRVMRPFFSFYGSKWRSSGTVFPPPVMDVIVEPFAGSAGYSTRFSSRKVILAEVDEVIASMWTYLIGVPADEVRRLPVSFTDARDLDVPEEAKTLIGFWLNHGTTHPCRTPSSWMRKGTHSTSFWGPEIRERIASQVEGIRHWRVHHGSYETLDTPPATYFVDPPYQSAAGRRYVHDVVDFTHLGEWVKSLPGQVIACDQEGADWLPFQSAVNLKSTLGKSREVIYLSTTEAP